MLVQMGDQPGDSQACGFAEEGADVIGVDLCADDPHTGCPLSARGDLDVPAVEPIDIYTTGSAIRVDANLR